MSTEHQEEMVIFLYDDDLLWSGTFAYIFLFLCGGLAEADCNED